MQRENSLPDRSLRTFLIALGVWLATTLASQAQTPDWIWRDTGAKDAASAETCFFRKEFRVPFKLQWAGITAAGDDEIAVYLNGKLVASGTDWRKPLRCEVTSEVRTGANVLVLRVKNAAAGRAGALLKLEIRSANNSGLFYVTDKTWHWSSEETPGLHEVNFKSDAWRQVSSLGKLGIAPWGNVFGPPSATPAESLTVLPGFKAELLKSADSEEGSWICMTVDDRGRFIISPEKNQAPLLRVTLDARGQIAGTEPIAPGMRAAMGLLHAHDSLYVNGRGPSGVGLYRLVDSNHNDQFDPGEERLLRNFEGDNEHGYHAVVLGPDGLIYVMNGNHTKVPSNIAAGSPYGNYAEDLLLPRLWDPNGHAKGILAPGGYILCTDPNGQNWRLLMGGFRNTYDFDFDSEGEMFTFDSDMEWDIGCPWYRPTRVLHCVSAGEYGWRSGSGKWPESYADSLPSAVDIGLSSPTGVKFGAKSHFPLEYQRALFVCDWNYGKIFAVHLEPRGASYAGTFETFVSGKPLNVVDLEFGTDGAMYFILGGWKTQSGLYRVSYAGRASGSGRARAAADSRLPTSAANKSRDAEGASDRRLRRALESFHGRKSPEAVDFAWPHLNSADRWVRFAARIAIESQDLPLWKNRALAEKKPDASITGLLALARCGDKSVQPRLLETAIERLGQNLTEDQHLGALRVIQISLTRMGSPQTPIGSAVTAALDRLYPASSNALNRELSQLLVVLDHPSAVTKTISLMERASTQEEPMWLAYVLRTAKTGWTLGQRRSYFQWLDQAVQNFRGGNSFDKYLIQIRKDAVAGLTLAEKEALAPFLDPKPSPTPPVAAALPVRAFIKEWKFDDLSPHLDRVGTGRSLARGKLAFSSQCSTCHRVGNVGGVIGPDLSAVSARFNRRDLLDNILHPSKIISDRYEAVTLMRRDGDEINGCIVEETDDSIVVITNPASPQTVQVRKADLASRTASKLSMMPEGLLNTFERDEILDLLAYLEAGGNTGAE